MASAKIKRAIRRVKLAAKRQMRADSRSTSPEIKASERVREVYLRELQVPGATICTVAKKYGVTKQAVHAATARFEKERARHRERDKERRPALVREHTCRTCGKVGHNARRPHDEQGRLIEEDVA